MTNTPEMTKTLEMANTLEREKPLTLAYGCDDTSR
jgi:hypothetical protein